MEESPFRPNVTLVEGQSTHFDLDVRWQEDLHVVGRLRIRGRSTEGWTATIEPYSEDVEARVLESVGLDAHGGFRAPALAGEVGLVLCSNDRHNPVYLRHRLTVGRATLPVEIELEWGVLHLERLPSGRDLRLVTYGCGDQVLSCMLVVGPDGTFDGEVPVADYSVRELSARRGDRGWRSIGTISITAEAVGGLVRKVVPDRSSARTSH